MPAVNILMKPASSACNMNCHYCFYNAIAKTREEEFMGMLSYEMLEETIKSAFEFATDYCGFAYQGGEPTLAGIDFFKKAIELQKKHNKNNITVFNSLQTNGYNIDEEFAKFFKDNNFLIGVSLDGNAEIHNLNRVDKAGNDTFNKVMKSINNLKKYDVEFNVLSVITGRNAKSITKIYNFFKKEKIGYLQFIPCLEPIENERGSEKYYLSPKEYGKFLRNLFDLWYNDFVKGEYVSIRNIDNIINIAMGRPAEICTMQGSCSIQFVIEGNGNVYPCDFFAFDNYKIGQIGVNSLEEMLRSETAVNFIKESVTLPEECKSCKYVAICRNGCKRDRVISDDGFKNYYCSSQKEFYEYAWNKINHVISIVKWGK